MVSGRAMIKSGVLFFNLSNLYFLVSFYLSSTSSTPLLKINLKVDLIFEVFRNLFYDDYVCCEYNSVGHVRDVPC